MTREEQALPPGAPRKRASMVAAAAATVTAVLATMGVLAAVGSGSAVAGSAMAAEASGTPGAVQLGATPPAITSTPSASSAAAAAPTTDAIRNVVFLLADDLDWAAFNEVPRLAALKEQGTTLTNFVVTDSLCCPSRASILRSQFVHNHKVVSNVFESGGGWQRFYERHLEADCLPTWLDDAGIETAMVGKYLNGFPKDAPSASYVPPGWDHFATALAGNQVYTGYGYTLSDNGDLRRYRSGPDDFVSDVLTENATDWLSRTTSPFFLQFASYSPHTPAPAAERNIGSHEGAQAPRPPSFNAKGANEPSWLAVLPEIQPSQLPKLDTLWTRRLESAESIADSYDALVAQLAASGHLDDTLIIVTSDNGYHVGTHRQPSGKSTPYREDSVVPAVFIGPGIPRGATIDRMASTIDLAPTIADVLGAATPLWADGRSLMPLLQDPEFEPWRNGVLIESLSGTKPGDPDYTDFESPVFHALRTPDWLYVEYGRNDKEIALYDLVNDPYEIDNSAPTAEPSLIAALAAQLAAFETCEGPSCRVADSMPAPAVAAPGAATPSASPSG